MTWIVTVRRSEVFPVTSQSVEPIFSEAEILYLEQSWSYLKDEPLKHGKKMFRRLFEQHPTVMKKFYFAARNKYDIEKIMKDEKLESHAKNVINTITAATTLLRQLDNLIPILTDLGGKHAKFNPQEEHFQAVGEAVLWMITDEIGNRFQIDKINIWKRLYGIVTNTMMEGIKKEKAKKGNKKPK